MKYKCKENDCLIEMEQDKSEILISAEGDTVQTVIGLKDLHEALVSFDTIREDTWNYGAETEVSRVKSTDKKSEEELRMKCINAALELLAKRLIVESDLKVVLDSVRFAATEIYDFVTTK